MIAVTEFAGRNVAVFGLGASGLAVAQSLRAGGARVIGWDDSQSSRGAAQDQGIQVDDLTQRDWGDIAALIIAPGVPLTHPKPHRVVQLARLSDTPIMGDFELFARALAAAPAHKRPKVAAITGTNGKSTTTALLGHVVQACGRDAQVGGNIGEPVLALDPFHAGAVYVLEVSSFQLDLVETFAPDVAVLLNITPDHLDRHGDMVGYVAAKTRIFARQQPSQYAVVCVDDDYTSAIARELRTRAQGPSLVLTSASRVLTDGVHAVGGVLYDGFGARVEQRANLQDAPALMGRHNHQNATAAYAAAICLGLDRRKAANALLDFPGLAHRMENAAQRGQVRFVNDSKATNIDSARQALGAFDNIFWIAGGRAKGSDFIDLIPSLSHVRKAYFIGEAAETMAAELGAHVRAEISRDLETAIRAAARDASHSGVTNPVVLLSPACASFDQFANFAARGDAFRSLALQVASEAEIEDAG